MLQDLCGTRFARLTVVSFAGRRIYPDQTKPLWNCVCDCGNTTVVQGGKLRSGVTRSCGCLVREAHYIHGHACERSAEYHTWDCMIQRCTNKNNTGWRYYGGRGIMVCKRWHNFSNFLVDMGKRPIGLTLDRINNDGNYEPGNCRWATRSEQNRNQRKRGSCLI